MRDTVDGWKKSLVLCFFIDHQKEIKDTTRMIERNLNNDRGQQEHFIINKREQQEHYYQQQRQ